MGEVSGGIFRYMEGTVFALPWIERSSLPKDGTLTGMEMKEEKMAGRIRIVPMIAVVVFLLGAVAAIPRVGNAAARNTVVTGIVEYVRGDVVTVAGKTYDLTGARFQDGYGRAIVRPPDLRGWTVGILFRNGRIETVTVYRTLPQ
jgi:hypothetical protein